jgi:hypothetical protein
MTMTIASKLADVTGSTASAMIFGGGVVVALVAFGGGVVVAFSGGVIWELHCDTSAT